MVASGNQLPSTMEDFTGSAATAAAMVGKPA